MNIFYKPIQLQSIPYDKTISYVLCSKDTIEDFQQLWDIGILQKHILINVLQKSYNRIYGLCHHNNIVSCIIVQLCIIDYFNKTYTIRLPESWAWIYQTYTFPQYRRCGYATHLKKAVENILYTSNIQYIGTEVTSTTMQHINTKLGYIHLEQIQTVSDFKQWIRYEFCKTYYKKT